MMSRSLKLIALSVVVIVTFVQAGFAAGGPRGAEIAVTRLDGTRVTGELIAVKPGSLLLLSAEGADVSVDLQAIKSVRIARKSKAGLYGGLGGAAGFLTGFLLGLDAFDDEEDQLAFAAWDGLIIGGIAAVSGLIIGGLHGIDSTFAVAGQPQEILNGYWIKLAGYSRQGRQGGGTLQPIRGGQAPPAPSGPRKERGPRFRLSIGAGTTTPREIDREAPGSFRFPGETGPEAGPYTAPFRIWRSAYLYKNHFRPTSLTLAYELTPHLAVESEVFDLGYDHADIMGDIVFVSSLDGLSYRAGAGAFAQARISGLLAGLAFRPRPPSAFARHIVEIGGAVGPGRARGTVGLLPRRELEEMESVRKTFLAGRLRAAYDFYPVPFASIGAVLEWRFAKTRLSGLVASGNAHFVENVSDPELSFMRETEVTLPPLPIGMSGLYWGLRISARI